MHYRFPGLLILAGSIQLYAQEPRLPAEGSTAQVSTYNESLPIYNGRLFYGYPPMSHGIPYYKTMGWQKGSILYGGVWYTDVSIIYDPIAEQLVVRNPRYLSLTVFGERVQEFQIEDDRFVRLYPDADNVIKEGFYRVLVEGAVTIYQRHIKLIKEEVKADQLELNVETVNRYYAFRDGHFYPVSKQKSLLALLKDKRQAIQQHLRSQKVKFKREPEKAITQIATFYNQAAQ